MRLAYVLATIVALTARAQIDYGYKGIFPVYEEGGQWLIYDKKPQSASKLAVGQRFAVIGPSGEALFSAARADKVAGGACRQGKPAKLRAALLKGPRSSVGRPLIAIAVPPSYRPSPRGSVRELKSDVKDATYAELADQLKRAAVEDVKAGRFPLKLEDPGASWFQQNPQPDKVQLKIDFGARLPFQGLKDPFVFVEETQIAGSSRRCLRLADSGKLVGGCTAMPHKLMAETELLRFFAYDPAGRGTPYLLAFTPQRPMWGDERWAFLIGPSGPRAFVADAMDVRCRESF